MTEGGFVHLVGGGPGDPGLITVRGIRLLRRADVILYDRLVNPSLLAEAGPHAELIDVGKSPDEQDGHTQIEITALMLDRARTGATVVRLKGGDPFLFGRGGEEASALAEAGIGFDIVPGVTSALAGPAYAGIPATDRPRASAVRVLTGQGAPGVEPSPGTERETAIVLMGVKTLAHVVESLQADGWPAEAPAALIEQATTARQRTTVATLGTIADAASTIGVNAPAILICGHVVNLRERIAWLEKRPLFGCRIMVLRGETRARELISLFDEAGAEVVHVPAVSFSRPTDWSNADPKLDDLGRFHCIAFTSANGVDYFMDRLLATGRDARALFRALLAVIGPATAAALNRHGLSADLMPDRYTATALADTIAARSAPGDAVLLPRGNLADNDLPRMLQERGFVTAPITVYRTLPGPNLAERAQAAIEWGVDAIILTSPSTARNLVNALGERAAALDGISFISAGPTTSRGAEEVGLHIAVEAAAHTASGIIEATREWARGRR